MTSTSIGAEAPADHLDIKVQIDGSDELHISRQKAWWIHKKWSAPTEVRINEINWDLRQSTVRQWSSKAPLFRRDLELSGAVFHKLRGRGSVRFALDVDGLVVHFDDSENGSDTYEVTIDFAQALADKEPHSDQEGDFECVIEGRIDGLEEVWLQLDEARWVHCENAKPTDVTLNGQAWDTVNNHTMKLPVTLSPEVMDLQKATLSKRHGRGIVSLDYIPERLGISLSDPSPGAKDYEILVRIPRFPKRHLIRVKADVSAALLGAALNIYQDGEDLEAKGKLSGQRFFDSKGQCLVALAPGKYQFEVLHKPAPNVLLALKTDVIEVTDAVTLDLQAVRVDPHLRGPENKPVSLDDFQIRSVWKTGGISWHPTASTETVRPTIWLSKAQSYHIHAFGHTGANRVAVWKELATDQFKEIVLDREEWLSCSFRWEKGTPPSVRKGVVLSFPDGRMEINNPESARLLTNRRFFARSYWLEFSDQRKAVFLPQGYELSLAGQNEMVLGGPLRPVASAAILEDEGLGRPDARHLWWEITLADAQDDLLDVTSSKINWKSKLTTHEGQPVTTAPLLPADIKKMGSLKETLVTSATFFLETEQTVSASPELFESRQTVHLSTQAPPYYTWNTRNYLAKAERELLMISKIINSPLQPNKRLAIKWWFNTGAVGGGYSVTMPISTYLGSRDWYSHTWAIAHEMLHNFGYGHSHEMNRLDNIIQERMEQFRWSVADRPEYVPEPAINSPHP